MTDGVLFWQVMNCAPKREVTPGCGFGTLINLTDGYRIMAGFWHIATGRWCDIEDGWEGPDGEDCFHEIVNPIAWRKLDATGYPAQDDVPM